jgi:hypothetical protein
MRPNSFFQHLNQDVRNVIYDHMKLYRFDHTSKYLNFVLACKQTKQEVEVAAFRAFYVYLTDLMTEANKEFPQEIGGKLSLCPQITSTDSLIGLKHLALHVYGPVSTKLLHRLLPLTVLHLSEIHIYFTLIRSDTPAPLDSVHSAGDLALRFMSNASYEDQVHVKLFTFRWDLCRLIWKTRNASSTLNTISLKRRKSKVRAEVVLPVAYQ